MNRAALGLAVGAGYMLGRTKKMKLAFAVGTMVAGKKLQLSPQAVMDMVRSQVDKNPQFKEISGQLREDFRGVGKAATGAILERQIEGLAGKLRNSTAGVRDRLDGASSEPEEAQDTAEEATQDADDDGKAAEGATSEGSRTPERKSGQTGRTRQSAERKTAPRERTQSTSKNSQSTSKKTTKTTSGSGTAKKTAGAARRAPRAGAKGERGNG
ncbi:DNA primase [Streptomyces sp. SID14478]|uniref:DNA primase n=1 Tax=Streptomyces sp. SID14478 TaxID=2706073 RepID=UPI0013DEC7BF|nr:DNA primase [Streptomyces sp. SID14478]NEB80656.1 DNA primase [Streptomyces sp. SID14478]